jgi:hypothetical protein
VLDVFPATPHSKDSQDGRGGVLLLELGPDSVRVSDVVICDYMIVDIVRYVATKDEGSFSGRSSKCVSSVVRYWVINAFLQALD